MKVEQIYTGCLAEASYYIESNGEVAIIDPLRESRPYIQMAEADHAKIKYVLETHFHADFVSGHVDLAQKTGATIVFGPTAVPAYKAHIASDGELLTLGKVKIKVLHTPGHTMESACFLLIDEEGKDLAVFTGDTLFIGDVGRPDLVQKLKAEITPEILAGHLYDSLRNKLMVLPDDVLVYPGHGAGSACGKKMDKETISTIGLQKQLNYALRENMGKEEFIKEVLDGLVEPPQYFPANVLLNVKGTVGLDEVLGNSLKALNAVEFKSTWEETKALVIDTRPKELFAWQFIPGSIFIGVDDNFAPWVGTLVNDLAQPILIIAELGKEEEVVTRLARVGYDNVLGYLENGMADWVAAGFETSTIHEITAEDFANKYQEYPPLNLLDVRRKNEFNSEHIMGAENFPLDSINEHLEELKKAETYYVHCAGGYRSLIAASILQSKGFKHMVNIKGGYKALKNTELLHTAHVEVNSEL
jgi:hydroxyacylglutathione hydrolase